MKKKFLLILALIVLPSAFLFACDKSDIKDQVANVVQAEDEHVKGVKNGTPNAYPGKTYGESFEKFFGSPTWKYFNGTKEGPDEDGDGKPDTVENNVDIVEFTGYCTYQNVEVKALIQFTLDKNDNTFEATYLSFNDVPQNNLMMLGLLEKVFEGDTEETTSVKQSTAATQAQKTVESKSTEFSLTSTQVRKIASGLNVPSSVNVKAKYGQPQYWQAGGVYLVSVSIMDDSGATVASASVDADTLEPVKDILTYSKNNTGSNNTSSNAYIISYSNQRKLTESDLSGLTKEQLRFARNEISARHGRKFKDQTLQDYFNSKSWYKGTIEPDDFSESVLNEYERYNQTFILDYENNK